MIKKSETFKIRSITSAAVISALYIFLVIYLMNFKLVVETLTGNFSLNYKATLLISLLGGMWTAMTGFGLATLITTAILTGINLTLVLGRFSFLYSSGNLHLSLGGSFLGFIGSGCATCGLPILSLLGLSGSLIYFPLRGAEVSVLAIILLGISFYFLVRNNERQVCRVNVVGAK